jgi:hypothetical protein
MLKNSFISKNEKHTVNYKKVEKVKSWKKFPVVIMKEYLKSEKEDHEVFHKI